MNKGFIPGMQAMRMARLYSIVAALIEEKALSRDSFRESNA